MLGQGEVEGKAAQKLWDWGCSICNSLPGGQRNVECAPGNSVAGPSGRRCGGDIRADERWAQRSLGRVWGWGSELAGGGGWTLGPVILSGLEEAGLQGQGRRVRMFLVEEGVLNRGHSLGKGLEVRH